MKKSIKLSIFLPVLIGLTTSLWAQSCGVPGKDGVGSLSGNINTYYAAQLASSVGSGTNFIPLGSPVGAASTATAGDLFVIIQMQCASINTTNTNNYGAGNATGRGYTDAAGSCLAGRYQYLRAGPATTATSLDLTGSALTGIYVQDALATTNRRTYQVIKVPQYSSVTLAGNISPLAWNGTVGGVVLLDVSGTLNMAGFTIDVSGRGFRGGGGQVWNVTADTAVTYVTATDIVTNLAGFKGEGIAGTPAYVFNAPLNAVEATGTDYTGGGQGKGAPGNAGGGGDNWSVDRDNGGGGGGGNGAIGGFGAYGWSGGGWPSGAGQDLRGIGGAAFTQNSTQRLVMGGGGGAGANNNSAGLTSSGGAGGGIVMIRAGTMVGNGTINANGAVGQTQLANDSGGGGGAGGSVLVNTVSNAVGALTINAVGGAGGDGFAPGNTAHAGGGGGSGGVVYSDGGTINQAGGAYGLTNIGGCPLTGAAPCSAANGASAGGAGISSGVPSDPLGGGGGSRAQCLPNLTVTKSTTTPVINASGATTATYNITVSNSGAGPASAADIIDNTLPPGWTFASTTSVLFSPALSSTTFGGFVESATPGVPAIASAPGSAANLTTNGAPTSAPVWANLNIPGNGSVTLTYVVNIPASASVGVFHNPAGVRYLDPTRSTVGREITPLINNTANRAALQVGGTANTTYETGSLAGSSVAGSNYSGLVAGTNGEDIKLVSDFSVTKTHAINPMPVSGAELSGIYTVVLRNEGRAIKAITYAADQATPATVAQLTGTFTLTDTLPTGFTLNAAPVLSGTDSVNWSCTGTVGSVSFICTRNASAGAIPAATDLLSIAIPVRVSASACPGPQINTAIVSQAAIGESNTVNNSASDSTPINCAASVVIEKTDNKQSTITPQTNTYVLKVTNNGPAALNGAVLTDVIGIGLNCSSTNAVTCSVVAGASACPTGPLTVANLTGAGINLDTLPASGSLQFQYACNVN